ncbi:MAG TPA: response regulator [Longimicrobium sp.]|jgi:CheY-like chemotaxis protein
MSATILLVEDNADNQAIYRTILEHSGFTVVSAWDGEEAVSVARATLPDLIFMDISIPKMDGLAATRVLKADETTAGIPIVALTAHAMQEDRAKALEAGCDAYLAKPVEPRRVMDEARRWTSGAVGAQPG